MMSISIQISASSLSSMGNLAGSVIVQYDEKGCNAMVVSITYNKVYTCTGFYSWYPYPVTKVNGVMTKMDFNFFVR